MSQIICPQQGNLLIAQNLLTVVPGRILGLFRTNLNPTWATTNAALVESTFPGYAAFLPGPIFTNAALFGQGAILRPAGPYTFTCTADCPLEYVYGWFLLGQGNRLLAIQQDPAGPFPISKAGDSYTVTPQMTVISQFLM